MNNKKSFVVHLNQCALFALLLSAFFAMKARSTTLSPEKLTGLTEYYKPVVVPKSSKYSWYRISGTLGKVGVKDNGDMVGFLKNVEVNFNYGYLPGSPRVAEVEISVENQGVVETIASEDRTGIKPELVGKYLVAGYHTTNDRGNFRTERRLDYVQNFLSREFWPENASTEVFASYPPFLNHVADVSGSLQRFKSMSERSGRLVGVSRHRVRSRWFTDDGSYGACLIYISELGLKSNLQSDGQGGSYELTRSDVQPIVGLDERLCAWAEQVMSFNFLITVEYREYFDSDKLLSGLPDAHIAWRISIPGGRQKTPSLEMMLPEDLKKYFQSK